MRYEKMAWVKIRYRAPSLILADAAYPPGPLTGVSADAECPLQWHA